MKEAVAVLAQLICPSERGGGLRRGKKGRRLLGPSFAVKRTLRSRVPVGNGFFPLLGPAVSLFAAHKV